MLSEKEKLESDLKNEIKKCQESIDELYNSLSKYRKVIDDMMLEIVDLEERKELLQKLILSLNED